jgi:predicted metal-dependent enzyme (double-stranded beta helix superfamily)
MTVTRVPALEELIHRLDEAVAVRDDAACCRRVKQVLVDVIGRGERFLDAAFLRPAPDRYARRLVHRDPAGR